MDLKLSVAEPASIDIVTTVTMSQQQIEESIRMLEEGIFNYQRQIDEAQKQIDNYNEMLNLIKGGKDGIGTAIQTEG
jgi:peptidoglycan hydrolase CwlO-like protein